MSLKSFADFTAYCRSIEGELLTTLAQSKPFVVEVEGSTPYFVPQSSGRRRRANAEKTEQVLSLLAESNDWSPSKYQAITYHASYILAIAKKHQSA